MDHNSKRMKNGACKLLKIEARTHTISPHCILGTKGYPDPRRERSKIFRTLSIPISNQVLREFVWCSEAEIHSSQLIKKKGSMVKSQKLPRNEGDHNTRKWKGEKLRA